MATSIVEKSQLRLEHDNGVVDGKQRIKAKTLSNIKVDASDDSLYAVGTAVSALSTKEVLNVKKVVTSIINA